jgi:HK97 family phage prohead protease
MSDLEIRTIDTEPLELRAAANGDGMTFMGYAARYDSPSLPLPFTERIAPGAFTLSLKSRAEIRAYVNHDDTLLLGSRRAGTLRIDDRADGGWVEIDLPDTTWGRDIRTLVERGDIGAKGNGGMSFGFSTVRDKWNDDGTERTLVEAKLWEVSVVTGTSAYMSSTASMVRNINKLAQRTSTDVEQLAEAMTALQAGDISDSQAALLRSVVDQVSPQVVAEATTPMSVLAAKLQLAEKALGL